jgi:hypothetical protein
MSPRTKDTAKHRLARFFHDELDNRYRPEQLREIDELRTEGLLEAIPEEQLSRIKEFFKRVMYPVGEEREARDRGVETVEEILNSTSSLISLLPKLPGILFRHGGRLPAIASAGLTVVSTYRLARHTEEEVLRELLRLCEEKGISPAKGDEIPYSLFRRAYGTLDEKETRKILSRTEEVVRLGMDKGLMSATIEIVDLVRKTREDPEEQDALEYLLSVLQEVHDLSEEFSREEVERILRLSEITEAEYFDTLREEA